jgi:putative ABC transport system permease protein
MNPLRRAARSLRLLVSRRRIEAEMAEEMRFHLEQRTADYLAEGMSIRDARDAAQRQFGNLTSIRESAWDARGWRWLEYLWKDLRFALRQLAKSPGFSLLAIVTLGLGIGANTSMFNVFETIMFKPLPYADGAQLDRIYRATAQNPEGGGFSPADFLDLRHAAEEYGEIAAYTAADASLSEPGRPAEMAEAARVTANIFSLLGVQPEFGRVFRAGEDVAGRDRIVILSQRTWQRRFMGSPDVIGRTIRIDGEPHQIVGVLPESFNDWRHLGWVDFFRPLALDGEKAADRGTASLRLIGRRSPARTRVEADEFIAKFGARLASQFPEVNAGTTWRAVPLDKSIQDKNGPSLIAMLIALSGFVLLIACSNLANFLLARTMARAREFAVRSALGASRTQLLRPLIAESLVLALAGGVCALFVAYGVGQWLAVRSTGDNGERVVFSLDWSVFGWAFAASLVTAVAFGVAPALFALRLDLNGTLKSGGRGATGGRGHQRFRQALIVGQFALAMVLLAAAGLMIRGLDELNHRRSGWESARLVTATYLLPAAGYKTPDEILAFHRRTVERLRSVPGVDSVSIASFTPFFHWPDSRRFVVEGRERPERGLEPAAAVNAVTPRYFETFGTHVLAGRAFTERDSPDAHRVLIVNQRMATKLFGNENPVGRRLAQADGKTLWGEIVGVAADVESVVPDVTPVTFQVYVPMAQEPRRQNELAVRATGAAPSVLVPAVRAAMAELDPDLPLRKLQSADSTIFRANYQTGVLRDILTFFAVLGLGLACLGIYGVIARLMTQRTSEFAIRLALGASVADISRLVLASGVRQALAGSALGLVGAFGVARLIAATQTGMRIDSAGILLVTTLLLVAVALLACWMPARRAGKIDATLALRAE